jgi:hypothetical protein
MREDGFYLELPALQQGLLWGVARLAGVTPERMRAKAAIRYTRPYCHADDPVVKGLAALALGRLGDAAVLSDVLPLLQDCRTVPLYQDGVFQESTVAALAKQAIVMLGA